MTVRKRYVVDCGDGVEVHASVEDISPDTLAALVALGRAAAKLLDDAGTVQDGCPASSGSSTTPDTGTSGPTTSTRSSGNPGS